MTTLFISDLHLEEKRPDITRAFLQFLADDARGAEALYILGDLFEAWIGDDDDSALARQVQQALRELSDSGTRLYFVHGNRDFLLGQDFAKACGGELLTDPALVELYGTPTLILHGDSLCTRDTEYMKLREQLRSPVWQQQILAQPIEQRRELARNLRMASAEANSNKAEDIMDVTPEEVICQLQQFHCRHMIHGHTHRPAVHQLEVDGQAASRTVLGDWDSHCWWLSVSAEGQQLLNRPL